jgi:hypothetical protein
MKKGSVDMQLLKIDNNLGHFLDGSGGFQSIDRITKEELLRLVGLTLTEEVEFDEYDEKRVKNQAHQIVYKSIFEKLRELKDRKEEFLDESARLYLAEHERYKDETSQQSSL